MVGDHKSAIAPVEKACDPARFFFAFFNWMSI